MGSDPGWGLILSSTPRTNLARQMARYAVGAALVKVSNPPCVNCHEFQASEQARSHPDRTLIQTTFLATYGVADPPPVSTFLHCGAGHLLSLRAASLL